MKISELIEQLESLKQQRGDIAVLGFNNETLRPSEITDIVPCPANLSFGHGHCIIIYAEVDIDEVRAQLT